MVPVPAARFDQVIQSEQTHELRVEAEEPQTDVKKGEENTEVNIPELTETASSPAQPSGVHPERTNTVLRRSQRERDAQKKH